MSNPRMPAGLGAGGKALWKSVVDEHDLDGRQIVQLTEACRMKDRCDKLDLLLRGEVDAWATVIPVDLDNAEYKLQIAGALTKANETANGMKQLLAALRLPDPETGKRPQRRGPRGAQKPTQAGGAGASNVSSMERARRRAESKTG